MNAANKIAPPVIDMGMVRALRRISDAGFSLALQGQRLIVSPADQLNEAQDSFIRTHKTALVALLQGAETLAGLLEQAGTMGLGWREGTDWDDRRLLAAGEILYSQRRMVNVLGRRYAAAIAPFPPISETHVTPYDDAAFTRHDTDRAIAILCTLHREQEQRLITAGHSGKGAMVRRDDYWKAMRRAGLDPDTAYTLLEAGRVRVQAGEMYWIPEVPL